MAGGHDRAKVWRVEICRARQCGVAATLLVRWRNPNLPWARAKDWPSCATHAPDFLDYVTACNWHAELVPLDPASGQIDER